MNSRNTLKSKDSAKKWILIGIPVLFVIGSLMHFLYDWSDNLTLVGVFVPINESVWEHLKMTFWPMMLWWFVWYFIYGRKKGISASQWFTSCAVAQLAFPLVILSFYYTYTGALGIESLILDIFSLFLGIVIAQGLALHVYKNTRFNKHWLYYSLIVLILLAIAFTVFTFYPPHVPLFKDSSTGNYGL